MEISANNYTYALKDIELLTIMIQASLSVIDNDDDISRQFIANQPYQHVLDNLYFNLTKEKRT